MTLLLIYVILIVVYLIIRTKNLKKKNIDFMKELSEPLDAWDKYEEKCKKLNYT